MVERVLKLTLLMFLTLMISLLCPFVSAVTLAAESEPPSYIDDLSQYDFEEVQEYLKNQQMAGFTDLSFTGLMKELMSGNLTGVMEQVGGAVKETLFAEIRESSGLLAQIMVLGLIAAVFTNFSSVFTASQISETGFFVTYLLLFTYLATSFFTSITLANGVVDQINGFMKALVPAYFLAVAFAGSTVSAAALSEFTLLVIAAVQGILCYVLIPLVRVYILLVMAGHISREDILTKMTELIKNLVQWTLKTLMGVVLGFHLIQGLVLPYVDSMKHSAVQKFIEVIPGIGQGAGAVTQMVLGSGVLIKNTIGAAAVVILLAMVLLPLLKLGIMMLLYQCAAAVMQPVCDKRVVSCISETAQGHKLLLSIVTTAVMLFVITIAVVCTTTNTAYFAG